MERFFFSYRPSDLERIPPRPAQSPKGTFGRVLVIGGSPCMSGAAYLSAKAASSPQTVRMKSDAGPSGTAETPGTAWRARTRTSDAAPRRGGGTTSGRAHLRQCRTRAVTDNPSTAIPVRKTLRNRHFIAVAFLFVTYFPKDSTIHKPATLAPYRNIR